MHHPVAESNEIRSLDGGKRTRSILDVQDRVRSSSTLGSHQWCAAVVTSDVVRSSRKTVCCEGKIGYGCVQIIGFIRILVINRELAVSTHQVEAHHCISSGYRLQRKTLELLLEC